MVSNHIWTMKDCFILSKESLMFQAVFHCRNIMKQYTFDYRNAVQFSQQFLKKEYKSKNYYIKPATFHSMSKLASGIRNKVQQKGISSLSKGSCKTRNRVLVYCTSTHLGQLYYLFVIFEKVNHINVKYSKNEFSQLATTFSYHGKFKT